MPKHNDNALVELDVLHLDALPLRSSATMSFEQQLVIQP
jgi:hypothetical protein